MIRNYFKIAVRNLLRHKAYSFINVLGLAIGIACCLLIMLYVVDELSYDRFNKNADRIYRVTAELTQEGETVKFSVTSPPMGPAMEREYPEIQKSVRLHYDYTGQVLMKYGDKKFYESNLIHADPSFFEVFTFPLKKGDSKTALSSPNSIILTEESAKKYFGDEDPMGEVLSVDTDGLRDFIVTGVLDEVPDNSHIKPEFIIPFEHVAKGMMDNWWTLGFYTYVLLPEKYNPLELEDKMPVLVEGNMEQISPDMELPVLGLQPLTDVHLYSDFEDEEGKLNNRSYIYLLSALAVLIVLIAGINFMNLSTARSQERAKEIGMRKVMGAFRFQLVRQFLAESLSFSILAFALAVIIVEISLPYFNSLSEKSLSLDYINNWFLYASLGISMLLIGAISGLYPALFLSKFLPSDVLRGKFNRGRGGVFMRRALVIVQFTISIGLVASTFVVFSQLDYMKRKDPGFKKDNIIVVELTGGEKPEKAKIFKNFLRNVKGVTGVSSSSTLPGYKRMWATGVKPEGADDESKEEIAYSFEVDYDFISTLEAEVIAGRDFSREMKTDEREAFIINETAVKKYGWISPEDAIGKELSWLGAGSKNPKKGKIIGVVKDFNFTSLNNEIQPVVMHIPEEGKKYIFSSNYLFLRVQPGDMKDVENILRGKWAEMEANHPLNYSYMELSTNNLYKEEEKLGTVFSLFSMLAILVACLGLFGLAAFTVEQRYKEIGIRKVLGASVSGIVSLLSREMMIFVLISNIIAWPLAYFFLRGWLDDFAYHTELSVWIFILSGMIVVAIALLTVILQTFRAALANPVKVLRYE